jgi:transcriptional regulator with XRE-family HTH domain
MKKKNLVNIFLQQVGDNIRKERIKKGYTLAGLGEDIGLDKSNMHRIEQGRNITLTTLLKIAAFLEIHPTKLFTQTTEITIQDVENFKLK